MKLQRNISPPTDRKARCSTLLYICGAFFLGYAYARYTQQNCEASNDIQSVTNSARQETAGWNSIDIFYGSTDMVVAQLPKDQRWFAQANQDEVVIALLGEGNAKNGYFIDLAANDATVLSNTYTLEREFGWKGLCIEPNPKYWYNLAHYRPNCQIVSAVVGTKRMQQVPFAYRLELGGIIGDQFPNKANNKKADVKTEYTVALLEVFERYKVPHLIDYMSFDVEGAEEYIMESFPLDDYKIKILTVERPNEALRKKLQKHGYKHLCNLSAWGETLWVHSDHLSTLNIGALSKWSQPKTYFNY